MSESYFNLSGITALSSIPAGSSVHVIGVCGVAMAPLAIALSEQGYQVSGSDKEFFEPMGSLLKKSSVVLKQGFSADHLPADCALAVIGNAVTKNNVEVIAVGEKQYRYTIFPKLLRDIVIADRHSVVVTGTHGKTTTTSMGAAALQALNQDPSFFIGGQALNFPIPLHIGSGIYSVVEGDEYDSSFFAKVPKFSFYDPRTLIVTSIEFDHADIYESLEAIERQFTSLIKNVPLGSIVVANNNSAVIARLLPEWAKISPAKIVTYGQPLLTGASSADYTITGWESGSAQITFPGGTIPVELSAPGAHNAGNALAIFAALYERKFEAGKIATALATFRGVKRRQEIKISGPITLIDDFAHHPTAVHETLHAIRTKFPGRRVIALFEPRSATSRRKVFQQGYIDAFKGNCDGAYMLAPKVRELDNKDEMLDVHQLAAEITRGGTPASCYQTGQELFSAVTPQLVAGDVVVSMSNGSFDGLLGMLERHLTPSA